MSHTVPSRDGSTDPALQARLLAAHSSAAWVFVEFIPGVTPRLRRRCLRELLQLLADHELTFLQADAGRLFAAAARPMDERDRVQVTSWFFDRAEIARLRMSKPKQDTPPDTGGGPADGCLALERLQLYPGLAADLLSRARTPTRSHHHPKDPS